MSDIYAATDCQEVTLLGLLDLSACVDHDILLRRLEQSFGVTSTPLTWIRLFLHGRTQQVCYAGRLSAIILLLFGVSK